MQIRRATAADESAVVALGLRFATTMPAFADILEGVSEQTLTAFYRSIIELEICTIFVAEDRGGDVFGCLAIVEVPHPLTGVPFAEELAWWVSPERRGIVAGPRLLTAAIEWTRGRGLTRLKMGAPAGTRVGDFYESQGFIAVETAYLLKV